jgi:large repetitive protein
MQFMYLLNFKAMKLKSYLVLLGLLLLNHFTLTAQIITPFSPRLTGGSVKIKGDIVFAGNNIINRTATLPTGFDANGIPLNLAVLTAEANTPYNGTGAGSNNNGQNFEYIDIDGDATTFSSSRANLAIGTSANGTVNTSVQQCKKIVYAGLYWTASYLYDRAEIEINPPGPNNTYTVPQTPIKTDWNQIKFRIPGAGYIDIVADNAADPVGDEDSIILDPTFTPNVYNRPYVCYKNITSLLQGLSDPNGQYFVANQRASKGENGNGNSGGWGMVVIYESPTLPSKYISTFDGFANIRSGDSPVDFPVNGFQTLPIPFPVIAKIGVSALEGDTDLDGDNLQIRSNLVAGFTNITNGLNPANNFFNGSITDNNVNVTNRLPASGNTQGFDLDQIVVNNPGNSIIPNGETGATFRLTTNNDSYGAYLTTFAVDIIEPNILLTKTVENTAGVPIGGTEVNLCQDLRYVIGFQNIGNDNATSFQIKDVLPINVTFNPATDLILPAGVTFASYNALTREIILNIANNLVEINDPRYEIRIRVKVVCSCLELSDACSNEIKNQAFATYSGTLNTAIFSDEGSIASFGACNLGIPGSTNTLVDVDNCTYVNNVTFCGDQVVLTAAYGYQNYTWSGPGITTPTATPPKPPLYPIPPYVPQFNQSVIVTVPGTYIVINGITTSPCRNITQIFNVVDFGGGAALTNPILPYNENLPVGPLTQCPSDGSILPHIYLCGATDSQLLQTNIAGATITWQRLNVGGTCPVSTNQLCANSSLPASCWTTLGTGSSFTVSSAGEYRIEISFNALCPPRYFYFNVYQNLLAPTFVARDIVCTTPGQITINNVPATGYEFSLSTPAGVFTNVWQASNVFPNINTPGIYTVSIRQTGLTNGCVFTVPNIQILRRDMTVTTTVIQPLCFGGRGSILLAANNVQPQYTFSLSLGASLIGTFGPQASNTQNYLNLIAGIYTYTVTTTDGCTITGNVTIVNPPQLTVTAAITKPLLACGSGEITIYPVGGTPGPGTPPLYSYSVTVNGVTTVTTNPVISVPQPGGAYNIVVTDTNNCTASTSITILPTPPPTFNPTATNVKCYGDTTGAINFNVTSPSGTMLYSITGTAPFTANPVFTNLLAGTYSLVIQYTVGTGANIATCTTTPQTITITEPIETLSATGGVYQVACGSLGGNGIIRITNPQGGTPGYTYSFDGGVTYIASNQATVPPGTYTIYIKDANGCIFSMVVTLDVIPPPPTIAVATPTFNCNGTATTTVTVTNPSLATVYNYTYGITPPLVPPHPSTSNVFINVPCGTPTIAVNYELVSVPTFSNLLNETFGQGPSAQSPGINPAYCWNNQPYPAGQPCGNSPVAGFPSPPVCGAWTIEDNQYNVTSAINPNNCAWFPYRDHTSNGTNPIGRFLAVNIGSAAGPNGVLYSKQINDVIPNQPVRIELWVANLLRAGVAGADPDFLLELVDASNNVVASQLVGVIDNTADAWQFKQLALNPGPNTSLTFKIRSGSILYNGNDALIDDIRVFQLPLSCVTTRNFPLNIPCNQAFAAQITGHSDVSCAGANDGTITVAAQNFLPAGYQYSWDNGVIWSAPQFTSPQTLTVPAGYLGYILVRYASVPPQAACSFNLPQVIASPLPLVASATFTPVTCLTGSTITASAVGGNGGYQYQLTNSAGTIIFAYQPGTIFSNVPPGTYIVTVRDIKNCTDPINAPLVIVAPVIPTASINVASDLCYNGLPNTASIQVDVVGVNGPFQYYLNGSLITTIPGLTYTFTNITPGAYIIRVVDAFGCSVTLPSVTIAPQLIATGNVIKGLDCSTLTPNATIQGAINGGTAPYSYTVAFNGNPASASIVVTGSNFIYSAAAAGSYVFVITDAIGCTSTFTQVILGITNPTVLVTSPTVINCAGDATGSLTVLPAGGLAPYVINIVRSTPLPVTNYGSQVANLPAGNYTVTVTDANSCTVTRTVNILERPPITYTETLIQKQCTPGGTVLGSISTSVITGGTAPYTVTLYSTSAAPISIVTAGPSVNFPNLIPDTYVLEVVDANSCRTTHPNLILSDVTGLIINTSQPTPNCTTGATIVVTVVAAAGGPYTFGIANGTNIPPYSNSMLPADVGFPFQHTFSNLTGNTLYTFVIFDASTNCYTFQTATTVVAPLTNITANITSVNCIALPGGVNPIQFTIANVTAGATAVNYQVFIAGTVTPVAGASGTITLPSLTSPVITMPFAGSFYIQLVEVNPNPLLNGCSSGSGVFATTNAPIVPLSLSVSNTINANCNQPNALVTVQAAGGGGGPYTYAAVISGNPAPPVVSYSATNPVLLNSLTSLTWDVYVRDATGCVAFIPVTIIIDPLPTVTVPPFATNQCTSTGSSYTFTVTGTGLAPLTYAITSPAAAVTPYQSSPTFAVNAPGSYQVSVRDKNGCIVAASNGPLVIYPPIVATAAFTTQPVCNTATGQITVIASGGSGVANLSYSIAPNAGVTLVGNVFSNVAPGSYTITITDNVTSCSIPVIVNLAAPTPVSFNLAQTPVVCVGDSNGTITVSLIAGNNDFNYTYAITAGPVIRPNQASNVFTGLPAGLYTIEVTSGRGCTNTQSITVGQPTPIVVPVPTITPFACSPGTNVTNLATITVNGVTGGSGTYNTYQFLNSAAVVLQTSNSNVFQTSLTAGGTYTINVFDSSGCVGSTTAVILPFVGISAPVVTVTSPITCLLGESIQVSVTSTGVVGPLPLRYDIVSIPGGPFSATNGTGLFTGLAIGDYLITVTNPNTGCSVDIIHYVFDPNTFALNATPVADVQCFGASNGSVSLTFVDNVLPNNAGGFNYTITDSGAIVVASGTSVSAGPFLVPTGLAAGLYTVSATLTATPSCTAVTNFTIIGPDAPLVVTINSTPVTCVTGNNDGSITAVASGGWLTAPYQYQLLLGGAVVPAYSFAINGTNTIFTGLAPGTYTVQVRDGKGCVSTSLPTVLSIPAVITATVGSNPILCNNATTSITISNVAGGQGSNYSYTIKGPLPSTIASGPQPLPASGIVVVSGVSAGNYEIEITDGWSCSNIFPLTITQPTAVQASLTTSISPTCISGASLLLTGTGGTPPYSYSTTITGPFTAFAPVGALSTTLGPLGPGTYQYYIRDANGCISLVSNDIVVPVVVPTSIASLTSENILCGGSNTGKITVIAQNGQGGYVYTLYTCAGAPVAGATQLQPGVFTNLLAGCYFVRVTGTGGCTVDSPQVTITEPTPFQITYTLSPVTCFGGNNGSIRVQTSGGTGIVQYVISPLSSATITPTTPTDFTISNLSAGNYEILVQDQNGCRGLNPPPSPYLFTITQPLAPLSGVINVASVIDETCFGDNDGAFTVSGITGGTGPNYFISLSSGGTPIVSPPVPINNLAGPGTHVFTGLAGGNYIATLTDSSITGCPREFDQEIKKGVDVNPFANVTFPCVNNVPAVRVVTENLQNPPILSFDPASDFMFTLTPVATGLASAPQLSPIFTSDIHTILLTPGQYFITAMNVNGCDKVTQTFDILASDLDALTLVLSQGGLNEIVATSTGGSGGNTYVFNGDNNGSDNTYVYDATGNYTVTVTDSSGCNKTVTQPFVFIPIKIPDFFTPNGDGTNPTWSPQNTANYPNLKTYIYDRYGRKVKALNEGETWDGKYEGKELPSGDYWYVIKVNGDKDDSEYVGHFTLYR